MNCYSRLWPALYVILVMILVDSSSFGQSLSDRIRAQKATKSRLINLEKQRESILNSNDLSRLVSVEEQIVLENKKIHGARSLQYAQSLLDLGKSLQKSGKYREAEAKTKESLEICQNWFGKKYFESLNQLADICNAQGKNEKTIGLLTQHLRRIEKSKGKVNYEYTRTLSRLANEHFGAGRFDTAKTGMLEILAILKAEKLRISEASKILTENVATCFSRIGNYAEAIKYATEHVEITRNLSGQTDNAIARSLAFEASIHHRFDNDDRALRLINLSLSSIKSKKNSDANYRYILEQATRINWSTGNWGKARTLSDQFLDATKTAFGASSIEYANAIQLKGKMQVGNRAWLSYTRATNIIERLYGKKSIQYANALEELAEAELFEERFSGKESRMASLANLLNASMIKEEILGSDHPNLVNTYHSLAFAYMTQPSDETRDFLFDRAETFLSQALEIENAVVGYKNPRSSYTLLELARVDLFKKRSASALKRIDEARRLSSKHVFEVLPSLPEKLRLEYLQGSFQSDFHFAIDVANEMSDQNGVAELSTEWVLNGKSVSHQASLATKLNDGAAKNEQALNEMRIWSETRSQLAKVILSESENVAAKNQLIEKLTAEIANLEKKIANSTGGNIQFPKWTELQSVQKAIPVNGLLIEIVRFECENAISRESKPPRYAAWIIPSQENGNVEIVDLGSAKEMDASISEIGKILGDGNAIQKAMAGEGHKIAFQDLKTKLQAVSAKLWQPLSRKIGKNVEKLIISPDGALWLLPWAAILTGEQKFLVEDCAIQFVNSGRELVRNRKIEKSSQAPVIFADPDYDLAATNVDRLIADMFPQLSRVASNLKSRSGLPAFVRLAGSSVAEANAVANSLSNISNATPKIFKGERALETAVKELRSPAYLMISSHGFFMTDQEIEQSTRLRRTGIGTRGQMVTQDGEPLENPLLRCGLAFAGCNSKSNGLDDGILTGLEIASLNLSGTDLVFLSACQTATGEVNIGEGVAGLHQAFQFAGAQSVVATLWSIPNSTDTIRLTAGFFRNLTESNSKSEALRTAQIKQIRRLRETDGVAHPYLWAAFTLTGRDQ